MRLPIRLAGVAVVAFLATMSLPAPAHAAVDLLTCTASSNVTFEPGLQLLEQPQHIEFQVGYYNCVSTSHPGITSGTHGGSFDGERGCLSLPRSHAPTVTITWNTGETSTVAVTTLGDDVGGQNLHAIHGTVVAGLFTGARLDEALAQMNLDLLKCAVPPGITSHSGIGTVVIH